jgi:hypothetical protein
LSNKIMKLCWPLQVPLTAKSVLISLADHASDDGRCWPSLETLAWCTCASRRAVVDAIKQLEACGIVLADRTNGRHSFYTVRPENFQPIERPVSARTAARRVAVTSADAAPVQDPQPVQMPHRLDAQTSADAASTSADAAPVPVQMPPIPVQMSHSNHQEPSIEPPVNHQGDSDQPGFQLSGEGKRGRTRSKSATFDASTMELPDWLERSFWELWVRDRKARKKPITEDAAHLQLRSLNELRAEGFSPKAVIENAVNLAWQGLYRPFTPKSTPRAGASRHNGFKNFNYEGTPDGSLA